MANENIKGRVFISGNLGFIHEGIGQLLPTISFSKIDKILNNVEDTI